MSMTTTTSCTHELMIYPLSKHRHGHMRFCPASALILSVWALLSFRVYGISAPLPLPLPLRLRLRLPLCV
jgi:hypothetical protein